MAVRNETVRRQFEEALTAVVGPGEARRPAVYAVSGPSPWLSQGALALLGLLIFRVRPYFMAVTDRRVVSSRASG